MVDPTSDVGAIDEADAPECVQCGDTIVQRATHRVRTWIDDDAQVHHRHFCSDTCLREWERRDHESA